MERNRIRIGDPGPALTFIFTMLTMCIWGVYAGIYTGPTSLAVGLVQLACFLPYLICSILFYLREDTMMGSICLIFAVLFGGVGGFLSIAEGLSHLYGFEMSSQLSAIPFFWGAVSLLPLLLSIRKTASAISFLCFSGVVVFLTLITLVSFGILSEAANVAIKWICLFVAVSGLYTFVNSLLRIGGSRTMPEGKPLFKEKLEPIHKTFDAR
ncbi:hypothetical protein [Virgibacillus sediminis]|uniref:Transcriptional regulator n=1 Tax=Virgibacillus sediminis TaxID=202260 RepID=A0ABV7A1T0_9BACI